MEIKQVKCRKCGRFQPGLENRGGKLYVWDVQVIGFICLYCAAEIRWGLRKAQPEKVAVGK